MVCREGEDEEEEGFSPVQSVCRQSPSVSISLIRPIQCVQLDPLQLNAGGREGGRGGGREGGREEGRDGGREGWSEGEREGGRAKYEEVATTLKMKQKETHESAKICWLHNVSSDIGIHN